MTRRFRSVVRVVRIVESVRRGLSCSVLVLLALWHFVCSMRNAIWSNAFEMLNARGLDGLPGEAGLSAISCLRHNMLTRRIYASQTENAAGGSADD
ncbi:hypothetical protein QCE63_28920, partial [Caballeronia sp. LZ065]|nr:hypothetical protein [Caballeronia sp. LZ065]